MQKSLYLPGTADSSVENSNQASGTVNDVHDPKHGVDSRDVDEKINLDLDALVVGAGFGGCYLLYRLRQAGFKAKIVEAGSDLGGVWHWNCYPGARVDSQYPVYAYSLPEVYKTWTWTEEYPGSEELCRYFDHVDKVLDIKKDVFFNTKVSAAEFDGETDKWTIHCSGLGMVKASFFIPAIGFAAKRLFPDWPGLDSFAGVIHHSSFWPRNGVDVKGKRVAVIGTGATGIQIAQTCARDAGELTVFQRTPNLCCPMRQAALTVEQQQKDKLDYPQIFKERLTRFAGFLYASQKFATFDHTPEEREAFFEKQWQLGGFRMLANSYSDMMLDEVANREAYNFWAKKVRARITDSAKRDILAPLDPPHPFGGKRLSLEQDFYEQMDKPHVHIVDIKKNSVVKVVPEGIITADGKLHTLDIIALATGFDSVTGGLKQIRIQGIAGETLAEKWHSGTWTYLGISTAGFPNFFFLYGPHGPTAFSNGPSCVEPQSDWIVDVMKRMRTLGKRRIDAEREAELSWKKHVVEVHSKSLRDKVDGWYNGANVPGKPREPLNYAGGIPLYMKTLGEVLDDDFKGYKVL